MGRGSTGMVCFIRATHIKTRRGRPRPISYTNLSKKKQKKIRINSNMWRITCGLWHVTCDTWHVTHDMLWGVNILSKFQLPSSYCLWFIRIWRYGGKGSLSEKIKGEAVYRTAPATPGLLITNVLNYNSQINIFFKLHLNECFTIKFLTFSQTFMFL